MVSSCYLGFLLFPTHIPLPLNRFSVVPHDLKTVFSEFPRENLDMLAGVCSLYAIHVGTVPERPISPIQGVLKFMGVSCVKSCIGS